jgi:hypothetical protein
MIFNRQSVHNAIFHFALILIAVGLPISIFLVSLGGLLLAANWLAEADFASKFNRLKKNIPAIALIVLFVMHFLWLINSENLTYAFKDIRIKLPLLILPVVLGSANGVSRKFVFNLLSLFVLALALGVMMSYVNYFFFFDQHSANIRKVVFFASPVRFSILVVTGIFYLLYLTLIRRLNFVLFILTSIFFLTFLLFLQSMTGILLFGAMALFIIAVIATFKINSAFKWIPVFIVAVIPFVLMTWTYLQFEQYRSVNPIEINSDEPDIYSALGEEYVHRLNSNEVENGNYIYRYIATSELKSAWGERSSMDISGTDARGQRLIHTLFRYMTSKSLRKDAEGFALLTDEDVLRIEQGYPTAFEIANPFLRRQQALFFEINAYLGGRPSQGNSLSQRLIYWKTGYRVAKEHLLWGVGTGDVNDEMLHQYEREESMFDMEHRRRPHNQYLTFLISFGIFGLIYFVWLNMYSLKLAFLNRNFMALIFVLMAAMSFLTEDTLETQIGATYYAFFYVLFVVLRINTAKGNQFFFDEIWRNPVDIGLRK